MFFLALGPPCRAASSRFWYLSSFRNLRTPLLTPAAQKTLRHLGWGSAWFPFIPLFMPQTLTSRDHAPCPAPG